MSRLSVDVVLSDDKPPESRGNPFIHEVGRPIGPEGSPWILFIRNDATPPSGITAGPAIAMTRSVGDPDEEGMEIEPLAFIDPVAARAFARVLNEFADEHHGVSRSNAPDHAGSS